MDLAANVMGRARPGRKNRSCHGPGRTEKLDKLMDRAGQTRTVPNWMGRGWSARPGQIPGRPISVTQCQALVVLVFMHGLKKEILASKGKKSDGRIGNTKQPFMLGRV